MGGPCILVVDDELSFRLFLKTLFETGGYQVRAARNGKEGLEKARTKRPACIVLDVMMPERGGLEMYKGLKTTSELRDIPVVMLSAVAAKGFAHALKMIGLAAEELPPPDAYVEKPPRPGPLLEVVRGLVDQPAPPIDTKTG
ncbi:MAG: response regulator [Halodesulfovibrio sp.]